MNTAGIICEYNPIHNGHIRHMAETRRALGGDAAIVCVMSGSFVQRGDFAVFTKHARAEAAVLSGADLVLELPTPYAVSSAERFARAGVALLGATGVCTQLSFGSESGDLTELTAAAAALDSEDAQRLMHDNLTRGLSYATSRQKALDAAAPGVSAVLKSPNNLLGIEYLRAIGSLDVNLQPFTVKRLGAGHDDVSGCSSSALRELLRQGGDISGYMPPAAFDVYSREVSAGRGPVFAGTLETAILARLRALPIDAFRSLPDASEGLGDRLARYARSESSVAAICEKTKTKRYAMSRIRRMLVGAVLGITAGDVQSPPPYIRVLAANETGRGLIHEMRRTASLPVITKPAHAKILGPDAAALFQKEAAATDFYVLAFTNAESRAGGGEWRQSPYMQPRH